MRFETPEDLAREKSIMDKINKDAIKLGSNDLDFLIKDKAYIEIKSARCKHDKPEHYLISLHKIIKMQYANKKLPTYLFIQFTDKLMYIAFKDIRGFIAPNGREERTGSVNDIELMCHVEPSLFKEYKIKN